MKKNDTFWKCPVCDKLIGYYDEALVCASCYTPMSRFEKFIIDVDDMIPKPEPTITISDIKRAYNLGYKYGWENRKVIEIARKMVTNE